MIDNQQPYRERQLHLTTRFYGDRAFVLSRRGARRNVGSQPKFYRFRSSHCSDCLFGQLIRNLYRSMRAVFIANKSLFISQHIGWKRKCRLEEAIRLPPDSRSPISYVKSSYRFDSVQSTICLCTRSFCHTVSFHTVVTSLSSSCPVNFCPLAYLTNLLSNEPFKVSEGVTGGSGLTGSSGFQCFRMAPRPNKHSFQGRKRTKKTIIM